MNYIESFYNFYPNDGSINVYEMFSLNQNGTSAKYSKEEFKNIFKESLLESEEYVDDEILESAHAHYELGMLYEAKSHWFNSDGDFNYLDCESHVILIKNGEGYMIEKNTFLSSESLNEGLWDKIKSGWNKAKSLAKKSIKAHINLVKDGWDKLSYGAKKAWEFVKTCGNVVVQFVKDMSPLEWTALALSVLSAILGIVGAAATSVGVGALLIAISGVMQGISGGIHIYEGVLKYKHSMEIIGKSTEITPTAKIAAVTIQTIPEFVVGGGMILLGINDIVKGASTAINPKAALESLATGTAVKTSLKESIKTFKPGSAIEHKIEKVGLDVIKSIGLDVTKKASKEAVGKVLTTVLSVISAPILTGALGWLWKATLKMGQLITKGFDFLINIPSKLSSGIEKFTEEADGTFTKMIAKGLNKLVKPLTDSAEKFISKYIQPSVDKAKRFFEMEIKANEKANELLGELKHELHTGASHHAPKEKPGKVENPLAPKNKIDINKVSKKDTKLIKKAIKKSKQSSNESHDWNMKNIKSFNDLNFI